MNIKLAFTNERLLKGTTGVTEVEFNSLLATFGKLWHEAQARKDRHRAIGGGRKGVLIGVAEKLFFILFYLKIYPTCDLASFIFGVDRSRICRWAERFIPILEKALGRACVLPARKTRTIEELFQKCPEIKDIFLDGTERRTRRPKSGRNRSRRYSGKQKTYTRKEYYRSRRKQKGTVFVSQ